VLCLIPFILIFEEPDLGSSLVLLVIWLGAILVCGFSARKWAVIGGIGGGLLPLSWFFLEDIKRIDWCLLLIQREIRWVADIIFYNLKSPSSRRIYRTRLAFWYAESTLFLARRHTDFIFASWCEQMGFLGECNYNFFRALSYLF
jgi:rod shape determining protein RodA